MGVTKLADRQATNIIDLTSEVVNVLTVANGGSGNNTLPLNSVLLGNGTGATQSVAPGTAGNVLRSNGTTWESQASSGGLSEELAIVYAVAL